jgi:hypothetical protein
MRAPSGYTAELGQAATQRKQRAIANKPVAQGQVAASRHDGAQRQADSIQEAAYKVLDSVVLTVAASSESCCSPFILQAGA